MPISDNITRLSIESILFAIQMSEAEVEPQQCLYEGNILFHEKICTFSGECLVRSLLKYQNKIASTRVM